jgi:hypothetical protein
MTFDSIDPNHQLTNVLHFPVKDHQSGNTAIFSATQYVNAGDSSNRSFEVTADAKSGKKSMSDPSREELAALIQASEAKNETKLVRLEGKIDTIAAIISGKFDSLGAAVEKSDQFNRETRTLLTTLILSSAFALAGLLVAFATYGDALFGRGMDVRDVVKVVAQELAATKKSEPAALLTPPKTMNSSESKKIPEKD